MVAVRVDRSSGSPLGNPYVMAGDGSDRDEVCDAYDALLRRSLYPGRELTDAEVKYLGVRAGHGGKVMRWDCSDARAEMDRLRTLYETCSIQLECHCHPLRCHGDSIAVLLSTY